MRHAKRIRKNQRQYAERHAGMAEADSRSGRPHASLPNHRSIGERENGSAKSQQQEGFEMSEGLFDRYPQCAEFAEIFEDRKSVV